MPHFIKNAQQHVGNAPGTLTYTGSVNSESVELSYWEQKPHNDGRLKILSIDEIPPSHENFQWINVQGLNDITLLKSLGQRFGIHPLFLEDVLNPAQRPKVETIDDCLLVSLRALYLDEKEELKSQPVSFIISGSALFSLSDLPAQAWLDPIIKRLKNPEGSLQKRGVYYFLYALIDVLVDQYFQVLESMGDKIQTLDESIYKKSNAHQLDALYQVKKQLLYLNKQTSPVPEFIRKMPNQMSEEAWGRVKIYFDDLLDHSMQVQDTNKTYLDSMSNLFDLYFSLVNLRMNRTIQALTVITVVFLPLTLLAGIYGMNFVVMPGLESPYAFWWMLAGMVWLSGGILWILKRKGWF